MNITKTHLAALTSAISLEREIAEDARYKSDPSVTEFHAHVAGTLAGLHDALRTTAVDPDPLKDDALTTPVASVAPYQDHDPDLLKAVVDAAHPEDFTWIDEPQGPIRPSFVGTDARRENGIVDVIARELDQLGIITADSCESARAIVDCLRSDFPPLASVIELGLERENSARELSRIYEARRELLADLHSAKAEAKKLREQRDAAYANVTELEKLVQGYADQVQKLAVKHEAYVASHPDLVGMEPTGATVVSLGANDMALNTAREILDTPRTFSGALISGAFVNQTIRDWISREDVHDDDRTSVPVGLLRDLMAAVDKADGVTP